MSSRRFARARKERKRVALERIAILMGEAERAAVSGEIDRADRYALLARRVGMRYNAPITRQWRMRVCRGCERYLSPGKTARVRVTDRVLVITCLRCGRAWRMPFKRDAR
ncbi:MAG: hypothetical protein AB1665_06870 [Candidatus Thermoplasmatota archaeon]